MASVTYRINGKSDNRAIDSTKKGIEGLGNAAKTVNNIFKGFLALKAVQGISRQVNESITAFTVQQKAIAQLTVSIANNTKLTTGSLKRIVDYTSQLQRNTIYGDEVLQAQASYLAGMKLTEEQIRDTLRAATQLADTGIGTLESNTRNLAKTLNGMSGELGELIPGLRYLTKEQLMHGDAVQLVIENYKGFSEALAGTVEGRTKQMANLVGDLREKLGAIAALGKTAFLDTMKPYLEQMDDWLAENLGRIASAFVNLPQMAAVGFKGILQLVRTVFVPDNFKQIVLSISNAFENAARIGTSFIVNSVIFMGDVITDIAEKLGDDLGKSIVNGMLRSFYGSKGFDLLVKAIGLVDKKTQETLQKTKDQVMGDGFFQGVDRISSVALQALSDNLSRAAEIAKTAGVDLLDTYKTLGADLGNVFKPVIDSIIAEWSRLTNLPLPPAMQALLDGLSGAGAPSVPAGGGGAVATGGGEAFGIFAGTWLADFQNMIGSVTTALGSFGGGIIDSVMKLGTVVQLMDPVAVIIGGLLDVLGPFYESVLTPIINILKILGQTLGQILLPYLQMFLIPAVQAIAEIFIWLHNHVIAPLGNFIIGIIVSINNFIASAVNGIISLLNSIPFVDINFNMPTMDAATMQINQITQDNLGGGETENSYGSAASYTGAKDIYVNIYFDRSVVTGDAREIALFLRDEIREAEAMGY